MAVVVADIRAKFTVYADTTAYPDALIQDAINEAEFCIDFNTMPTTARDNAIKYLVAHLLVGQSGAGGVNGEQSVTAGRVSVSYDTSREGLRRTPYGQRYMELLKPWYGMQAVC